MPPKRENRTNNRISALLHNGNIYVTILAQPKRYVKSKNHIRGCKMFQTIRQTARSLKVPEHFIRSLVAKGICPGVYSGNRFLVNTELLREYFDDESRKSKEAKS